MTTVNAEHDSELLRIFHVMSGLVYVVMFLGYGMSVMSEFIDYDAYEYSRYFGSDAFGCAWWFKNKEVYFGTGILLIIWPLTGFLTLVFGKFPRKNLFIVTHISITLIVLYYFMDIGGHLGC